MEVKPGEKLMDGRKAIYWSVCCDSCGRILISADEESPLATRRSEAKRLASEGEWVLTKTDCLCPDCARDEE